MNACDRDGDQMETKSWAWIDTGCDILRFSNKEKNTSSQAKDEKGCLRCVMSCRLILFFHTTFFSYVGWAFLVLQLLLLMMMRMFLVRIGEIVTWFHAIELCMYFFELWKKPLHIFPIFSWSNSSLKKVYYYFFSFTSSPHTKSSNHNPDFYPVCVRVEYWKSNYKRQPAFTRPASCMFHRFSFSLLIEFKPTISFLYVGEIGTIQIEKKRACLDIAQSKGILLSDPLLVWFNLK